MKQDYDRVQYYNNSDIADGYMLDKSISLVSSFDVQNKYDVNDIIELFNTVRNIKKNRNVLSSSLSVRLTNIERQVSSIKKQIGVFFSVLSTATIVDNYKNVIPMYEDDFWSIFEEYKVYEKIAIDNFKFFLDEHFLLSCVTKHKQIISKYNEVIKEYMLVNVKESVQILINKHFSLNKRTQVYLPSSLTLENIEKIFDDYVSSEDSNPNILELIAYLPQQKECPISDLTRTHAKEKRDLYVKNFFNQRKGAVFTTDILVQITNEITEDVGSSITYNDSKLTMSISKDWIKNNTDYPTLLNNFIYILGVVDSQARICNIYKNSQAGLFEIIFSTNNQYQKMYPKGTTFDLLNNLVIMAIMGYSEFLFKECNIRIESIIEWFFTTYLKEEFNIDNFYAFMPSQESTYLEKCRSLCCEMESIIKQYSSYVRFREINHNLIENFSNSTIYEQIPSLVSNKYVYLQKNGITISNLLFLAQTLSFIPNKKSKDKESFYDLIKSSDIYYEDYADFQKGQINYLIEQNVICINSSGIIRLVNKKETSILKDICLNEFGSYTYYKSKGLQDTIKSMLNKGWIKLESSFLSNNEVDYFNYYLNKRDFSNGLDLRNRYLHGTQPKRGADSDLHRINYYTLMMLLIVLVIKINDELCATKELSSISMDKDNPTPKTI